MERAAAGVIKAREMEKERSHTAAVWPLFVLHTL